MKTKNVGESILDPINLDDPGFNKEQYEMLSRAFDQYSMYCRAKSYSLRAEDKVTVYMGMTFKKIEAGRYMFGNTQIVKRNPIPGRQQTTTWRDALTGKWLGYTLAEAKVSVKRQAWEAQQEGK